MMKMNGVMSLILPNQILAKKRRRRIGKNLVKRGRNKKKMVQKIRKIKVLNL